MSNIHATMSATESYAPDNLFAGDFPRVERNVVVASGGGVLGRGAVLGRITSGGKYLLSLSAASDGSQTPDAILAHDIDATSADADAVVYFTGEFQPEELTIGADHTAASIRVGLRAKSIFI